MTDGEIILLFLFLLIIGCLWILAPHLKEMVKEFLEEE